MTRAPSMPRWAPLLLLICLVAATGAARAAVQVDASISASQVGTGEPFRITVQVVSDEKVDNLPWPQVGGLAPFQVTKQSSNSRNSQTQIINGKVTQRDNYVVHFIFTLTAKAPGTYQVGPIRYTFKNYDRALGTATVTVTKTEPGLKTQATVSDKAPYVGQQVLYNLRIIPSAGVQQMNLPKDLQTLIGERFWFQRLDQHVEPKAAMVDGKQARVYDVRIVLFPLLSGAVELAGIPVEYQQLTRGQRRRTGSLFDMFEDDFFAGGNVVNLSTMADPVSLEVTPLPPGAPEGFSGSVGAYSLTASADKNTLPSGDALTLTVTIRGNGQPKSITKPVMPDLSQFEVFDPELTTASSIQGSTLITTKTFKYVMVPHRKGEYRIGPVGFPYFDPGKGVYVTAKSEPIPLTITQGKEITTAPGRVLSQQELADIGSDIRHIKVDASPLSPADDFLYRRAWFWALFAPPPALLALMLLHRRRSRRLESDATLKRKSLAGAQLRKRLKEAGEAMKQKNPREFHKALSQAVVGFAADKTSVELRGLTMEEAKSKLRSRGLGDATLQEYERVLQQCDFGQFAGGVRDEKGWKEALAGAENLLKRMEKEL